MLQFSKFANFLRIARSSRFRATGTKTRESTCGKLAARAINAGLATKASAQLEIEKKTDLQS
jgi:hypothetical protein